MGLKSSLVEHVDGILKDNSYQPQENAAIADAAILMAADGYGRGRVRGSSQNEEVVIRTSDTQKSFLSPKDPDPSDLAIKTQNILSQLKDERGMDH